MLCMCRQGSFPLWFEMNDSGVALKLVCQAARCTGVIAADATLWTLDVIVDARSKPHLCNGTATCLGHAGQSRHVSCFAQHVQDMLHLIAPLAAQSRLSCMTLTAIHMLRGVIRIDVTASHDCLTAVVAINQLCIKGPMWRLGPPVLKAGLELRGILYQKWN